MFGFGKNLFLGIDIGTSSIKMVELKLSGNKPFLSNYAWAPLPEVSGKNDLNSSYFNEILPVYLKTMFQDGGFKGKHAYVSLPAFEGLITMIDFPRMVKEEMEQAIRYEAQKYIPTSLEDVVLSWDIIGGDVPVAESAVAPSSNDVPIANNNPPPPPSGKVQVLLVAASKNKVAAYEKVINSVGFELKAIEIESFSLVSSLIGNDPGNFIIIDIGARVGNILLVEKGLIKANRNIDAGGKDMTRMIAKSMSIDESAAEKMKSSGRNFFGDNSNINFPTLENISGEVARMIISYYKNETPKVDSIILSGGTANFPGIVQYFQNSLKTKTIIGNPFGRLEYDKRLEPILAKLGGRFSVSLGLALKGVDEYLNKK